MRRIAPVFLVVLLGASAARAGALNPPLTNWSAPATWSPAFSGGGRTSLVTTDLSGPLPFIPISPCRLADTRGNGFTGQYGPPAITGGGTQRSFDITGQCGIPTGAAAV
jgi:hypothetical protein